MEILISFTGLNKVELFESTMEMNRNQVNGMYFSGLSLPRNAIIDQAVVAYTAAKSDDSDVHLMFSADTGAGSISAERGLNNYAKAFSSDLNISWYVPDWVQGQSYNTPDLAPLLQTALDDRSWSGAATVLQAADVDGARVAFTRDNNAQVGPKLTLSYYTANTPTESHRASLRFPRINIPKGTRISSAYIELTPQTSSARVDDVRLKIQAKQQANAEDFGNKNNAIEGTLTTGVNWRPGLWVQDQSVRSPDISSEINAVINQQADWCGGNALSFVISSTGGNGYRASYGFDAPDNFRPRLVVEYDSSSVDNDACQYVVIKKTISKDSDNAIETDQGAVNVGAQQLSLNEKSTLGLRFDDIPLTRNSSRPGEPIDIRSARLVFTSADSDPVSFNSQISAVKAMDTGTYSGAQSSISSLPTTSKQVSWNLRPSASASNADGDQMYQQYASPDLSGMISDVVNQKQWSPNSTIELTQKLDSGNLQVFGFSNNSQRFAPYLEIEVNKSNLVLRPQDEDDGISVRDHLANLVDSLQPRTSTPITDTYYEAARYYRGDTVLWAEKRYATGDDFNFEGIQLSTQSAVARQFKRVSNPLATVNAEVYRPDGCEEDNLDTVQCGGNSADTGERLESTDGEDPTYASPIIETCQRNFIILLSDGSANQNHSQELIPRMMGEPCNIQSFNNEQCARDLSAWLNTNDQREDLADFDGGSSTVQTYTIAFDLATPGFLQDMADLGGGRAFIAGNEEELTAAFNEILGDIQSTQGLLSPPSTRIDSFNRNESRRFLYFSLFQPTNTSQWVGNLKKYRFEDGDIVDSNSVEAIIDGGFNDDAQSFWTTGGPDGAEIAAGGAAQKLPDYRQRNIYTFYPGASKNLQNNTFTADNGNITDAMLGIDGNQEPNFRQTLIEWARGRDVKDEVPDSDNRNYIGDPLHTSAMVVNYDINSGEEVVFLGTNEGLFHAFDAESGEELFAFLPQSLMPNLADIYRNDQLTPHPYGLDGGLQRWVRDVDNDGVIEAADGDHVYLYVGMRRGGSNYYALDVTNPNRPQLLWHVLGGSSPYVDLSQSWSLPQKTRVGVTINGQNDVRDVLVFTGGYDEANDDTNVRTPDTEGLGVFMVDAGPTTNPNNHPDLIWAGTATNRAGVTNLHLPDMEYSMPSKLSLGDTNGDGLLDLMFAGNTGGQVWRFDINQFAEPDDLVSAGIVADLAVDNDPTQNRKFYNQAELVRFVDGGSSQLAVLIGTGWRANPLNEEVVDRMYMIKQPLAQPSEYVVITENDLVDATVDLVNNADSEPGQNGQSELQEVLQEFEAASGWYITKVQGPGEKVLTASITVDGILSYSTYEPDFSGVVSPCQPANGTARTYVVSLLTAAAVYDFDDIEDDDGQGKDRFTELDNIGIPPDGTIVGNDEDKSLVVGLEEVDRDFNDGATRTYWYQE